MSAPATCWCAKPGGLMHTYDQQVRTYNQADTLIPTGLAAGNATLVSHILHLMHEQKQ